MSAKYSLLPAQRDFIHSPSQELDLLIDVYQGGYGSGKTFIGSLRGLVLCEKYPGIRGLACAKTYPLLRDTTLQTYFEHFDEFGWVEGEDFTWKASEQKLIFPQWNKSEILFRHLEKPFKLKSLNLGWVHIEEMSEVDESIFMMLLSRLRQRGIPRHYLFGTTNPQSNKGWIHEYFVERNQGLQADDGTNIQYRRIIAPSTENIHLSAAYLKNMENQFDPEYYRINVLGQDGDYTAGLVSYNFSDLNITDTEYKKDQKLFLTCDFNVDPMSWALAHRYNGEYHFFDEIVIENTNIDACVDEFVRRYPEHDAEIVITGDASGNNRSVVARAEPSSSKVNGKSGTAYTQMVNRFNFNNYPSKVSVLIREANPGVADRVAAWNAAVCNTQGIRRVFINPRCKWLIWNCHNLHYKEGTGIIDEPNTSDIKQDAKKKFIKHVWDAASYLVEKYDPIMLKPNDAKREAVIVPNALNRMLRGR